MNPFHNVPEAIRSAKSEASRIPYIFTKRQIQDLLSEAAKLQPQHSLRPHTYRTLFGLLYTTGLRIGEALALQIKDFHPESMRLHIGEGKFHKSRRVPLSSSTCTMLQVYLHKRQNATASAGEHPLFISLRHSRLSHCTVNQAFCSLLKQCRIHKSKGNGPRIHDLRHTFAVHCLFKWYSNGPGCKCQTPGAGYLYGPCGRWLYTDLYTGYTRTLRASSSTIFNLCPQ